MIDSATKLKVIGRTGVGINNIDIDAATAVHSGRVYARSGNSRAVAEAAMAFILALSKRIVYWDQQTKPTSGIRDTIR